MVLGYISNYYNVLFRVRSLHTLVNQTAANIDGNDRLLRIYSVFRSVQNSLPIGRANSYICRIPISLIDVVPLLRGRLG
jgi:hypothetical protein